MASDTPDPWFRRFPSPRRNADQAITRSPAIRSNQAFEPLPPPTGAYPFRLRLEDVLPAADVEAIRAAGKLGFHCVGDTGGIQDPRPQHAVAAAMEADFGAGATAPTFFYHLGDVVYFYGEDGEYFGQFYEPYAHYPAPIVAIPGNHDGDLNPSHPAPSSLLAFVANFCAPTAHITRAAGDGERAAMTQPNVYWTLVAPFLTIIGLYTNVPDGGRLADDQLRWLVAELQAAPPGDPVIVALHHPIYSADSTHGSNLQLERLIHAAFVKAGRLPDAVLTAHVHNYQRFTRRVGGRQIPYIVAGGGGYHNLHHVAHAPDGSPLKLPWRAPLAHENVTLETFDDRNFGYMRMTASAGRLAVDYVSVPHPTAGGAPKTTDSWVLDTVKHTVGR